ncbi:hypothetical protein [Shimia thalassica]|uniref:hypothetical protein n=1 Tax=Shimia thalassica TaxID=1715693 RepID=UPI0024950A21|nr:hypothetical protein [Shimia thalassica]
MTALEKYERIEATGLWRVSSEEQRRDVIVSIGDASLTITDTQDKPLAHWSLPAVRRLNPGEFPAIYAPDGDLDETLELSSEETEMVEAIEKLRRAINRRRPRPGRLRFVSIGLSSLALVGLAVFWLPEALRSHAISVVPESKRQEIGGQLLQQTQRLTGPPCADVIASPSLTALGTRLDVPNLVIVRAGVHTARALPGGTVLLNRAIVEDYEDPEVAAGYIIAEKVHAKTNDPLRQLLDSSSILTSFRLLTTGGIPTDTLKDFAEEIVVDPSASPAIEDILAGFEKYQVRTSPYAYAVDPSGESTLELIEADPFVTSPNPVLSDGQWVALQSICGG